MAEDIEEILAEIDEDSMKLYQEFFEKFDIGGRGYVMVTQIGQVLHAMEQDFDERQLRKTVRQFDADGSGKLEFDEFAAMVYTIANSVDKETMMKELRDAFRLFDKEKNGYILTSTLREILAACDDALTDSDLDAAIAEIDTDGSGTVDFDEFKEMMMGEADDKE